jgi:hypothetical protein
LIDIDIRYNNDEVEPASPYATKRILCDACHQAYHPTLCVGGKGTVPFRIALCISCLTKMNQFLQDQRLAILSMSGVDVSEIVKGTKTRSNNE